jgi:hypothetical protein
MCKNYVERGRPQMTIWRTRIACCITKATKHTLTISIIYCFSTATMVAGERLDVTLYIHCLSCLVFFKTEYQYDNTFATICDNRATSCSLYPWILVPAVNRVLRAVICGIPLFHGDLVCRQSPFHYCTSALQACSVLKGEICILQRRSQISFNWVLCDTAKATHTTQNRIERNRDETEGQTVTWIDFSELFREKENLIQIDDVCREQTTSEDFRVHKSIRNLSEEKCAVSCRPTKE